MEDINSKKKKLTNRAELINLSIHPYLNQPCISFFHINYISLSWNK